MKKQATIARKAEKKRQKKIKSQSKSKAGKDSSETESSSSEPESESSSEEEDMDREMVVSKLNKVVDETEEVNFGFTTVEPDYLLSGFIPSIEHFVDMSRKAIDSNRLTHVECATKSGSALWNLSFTFSGGIMSPTEGTYRPLTQDKLNAGWEVSKITITPKLSQISFGLH
jgi:hypothetical protein